MYYIKNNKAQPSNANNQNDNFVKFELIIEEGYNADVNEVAHYHIVGKKKDETREEIIALDDINDGSLYVHIIGVNQNKLYYTDNNGFAYIDLSNSNYERISWIDFDEKQLDYSLLHYYLIKNNKLYFCKAVDNNDPSIHGSFTSSIYSLDFNDNSLDDATLVIDNAIIEDNISKNSSNNTIYFTRLTDNNLYAYNIYTKEIKTLIEDDYPYPWHSTDFYALLGENEILYIDDNAELRAYNLISGEITLLDDFVYNCKVKNDAYYYIKGIGMDEKDLIKVSGNDKTIIDKTTYTDDIDVIDYISSFEDILILSYAHNVAPDGKDGFTKYLVNEKIQDEEPIISVTMKDGNVRQFEIDLFEQEIYYENN